MTVDWCYFKANYVVVQVTFSGHQDQELVQWAMLDAYRIEDSRLAEAWHRPAVDPGTAPAPDSRNSAVRL